MFKNNIKPKQTNKQVLVKIYKSAKWHCGHHTPIFNQSLFKKLFIRPSDGRIMVWRCLSVHTSVCSVVHNPCGQNIARTMQSRLLKLSMYTSYGKRKKPIHFQCQRSNFKVTGPSQRILALGSLCVGYSENYAV